ncbi:hypothetical protein ColTof4_05708 [Colletotrichum tofieldiae]|nr:hypothetical protein ColTof3_00870 [Colletotrichum tofieldiae]GKT73285.1 hypothetical protein ColTof4_05708 [Colletotrichum tofieldiae]GKT88041.1 hypothetical protein Ct61P_05891 [Colletotrichum tofieldiae]
MTSTTLNVTTRLHSNKIFPQKPGAPKEHITYIKDERYLYKGLEPMYYAETYKEDPRIIKMSSNRGNYQHQLKARSNGNPNNYNWCAITPSPTDDTNISEPLTRSTRTRLLR